MANKKESEKKTVNKIVKKNKNISGKSSVKRRLRGAPLKKSGSSKRTGRKVLKIVPDTSIIIEGLLSKKIARNQLKPSTIIVHEAVMAELESQANKNRETGYLGLEEVRKLRELSQKRGFSVIFKGKRPTEFEIRHAKTGEIDSLIRQLAAVEKATLVTADRVQSLVAESKGVNVMLYEFEQEEKPFVLEKYFDTGRTGSVSSEDRRSSVEKTMSVHIKEECAIKAKKGKPGQWKYVEISKKAPDREEVKELVKTITEETNSRTDGFVESDTRGSTIIQLSNYRIVITRPPFADGYEITAVRPVKKLKLKEYDLDQKIMRRIEEQAEGMLIAGAPGHGKTTFAQALAEHYLKKNKVIKTIESPRDLTLSNEVTQYSMNYGTSHELHDILLLSRPDYTIFDEMRNTSDFRLFADLRLSGVGMIGVIHATKPIDAIQRFIGRIELGVIPHIVDTVIFIKNGAINRIFSLSMEVKVPSGMTEADLARPVVIVNDFNTGRLEFEIYTYGDETVVIPAKPGQTTPARKLAEETIRQELAKKTTNPEVEMLTDNKCRVYVMPGAKASLVGRQGKRIEAIEDQLGVSIDLVEGRKRAAKKTRQDISGRTSQENTAEPGLGAQDITYQTRITKQSILIKLSPAHAYKDVSISLGGETLVAATASRKGIIRINKHNNTGRKILKAIQAGEKLGIR